MSSNKDTTVTVPLYELLGGLGRRGRLAGMGYDPDALVSVAVTHERVREVNTETSD